MGLENTGEVPFRKVYLHGLIRDEKGEKMSKSRGNVVDPVQAIERYGTDALRFALSTGSSPGNDMRLTPQKLEGSRNFANKLWNAARFVISNLDEGGMKAPASILPTEDRWILSRLNRLLAEVNELLEEFQLGETLRRIHDFFWSEYCDWYIEIAKIRLRDKQEMPSPLPVLVQVLETVLRLLHPFMPFVTEEIWQGLRAHQPEGKPASIMIAPYPTTEATAFDAKAEQEMELVIKIVRSIRNTRAEFALEPARHVDATIIAGKAQPSIEAADWIISPLARARLVAVVADAKDLSAALTCGPLDVVDSVQILLPELGVADLDTRQRLEFAPGGIKSLEAEIARLEARLGDDAFLAKAPAQIIEKERRKLSDRRDRLGRLEERLARLG